MHVYRKALCVLLLFCQAAWSGQKLSLDRVKFITEALLKASEAWQAYPEIAEKMRRKHSDLELRFVVGNANPNFIAVAPESWDPSLEFEIFSRADALGRLLCPGHPRNPHKKFQLIVRADDPGDTLVHEYFHYLQAKSDPSLCKLYNRLEANPSAEDLSKNLALEYEVHRFILENRAVFKLKTMAEASILEKLFQYIKDAPEEIQKVDKRYGWSAISGPVGQKRLIQILAEYSNPNALRLPYLPTDPEIHSELSESSGHVAGGIALLASATPGKLQPMCVYPAVSTAASSEVLKKAIDLWNAGARQVGSDLSVFTSDCSQASRKVEVRWDPNSGRSADGILKLGAYYKTHDPQKGILLLRPRELENQRWLIAALVRKQLFGHPEKKAELDAFYQKKTADLELNLVAHELGHALGMAHNFNEQEKSIMNYSSDTALSDYDLDALRVLLFGPGKATKKWNPKTSP